MEKVGKLTKVGNSSIGS